MVYPFDPWLYYKISYKIHSADGQEKPQTSYSPLVLNPNATKSNQIQQASLSVAACSFSFWWRNQPNTFTAQNILRSGEADCRGLPPVGFASHAEGARQNLFANLAPSHHLRWNTSTELGYTYFTHIEFQRRFCFIHGQGPMTHKRFFLSNDKLIIQLYSRLVVSIKLMTKNEYLKTYLLA